MAENRESLGNLEQNLKSYGLDLRTIPWVIQFNKRDLPNALSVAQMNKELNKYNVPTFEAQAASSIGVFETLRGVSKLLLTKISKDVIDRDRGSLAASPRVKAEEAKQKPAAVEEAPTHSAEPETGRGKLVQFLKRGKGQEAPKPAREPVEETPMLADETLLEEPAAGGGFTPPPSMRPDEAVLTSEDLVPIREPEFEPQRQPQPRPQQRPQIAREPEPEPVFGADEIERESTYGDRDAAPVRPAASAMSVSSETRQITVPIELGSLPPSGRLKLIFEVRIEVDSSAPGGKKGKPAAVRGGSMMRDLEVIPD
jgi:hypothetical protein